MSVEDFCNGSCSGVDSSSDYGECVEDADDATSHHDGCTEDEEHSSCTEDEESDDPEKGYVATLFLPSRPTIKELSDIFGATKNGLMLTGSAAKGPFGPSVGRVDIGECEDSYLFRVSLPGVKREENEFSCDVSCDGKVLISGVTMTGEKTVSMYNQVFEMQTFNLCPPGEFTISFQLPGPVDPLQFDGTFGTNGILEAIVMKVKRMSRFVPQRNNEKLV